jgi:hypothetical protein
VNLELRATTELVQAGDTPASFRGFATENEAFSLGLLQNVITAVVRDVDGMYHLLNVNNNQAFPGATHSTALANHPGLLTVVRLVNPGLEAESQIQGPERPESWAERVTRARELRERFYDGHESALEAGLRAVFTSLATEALQVAPSELHIMLQMSSRPSTSRINILLHPDADEAGGLSGIGTASIQELMRTQHEFGLYPTQAASGQRPWVLITAERIERGGAAGIRSTFRHEATHAGTTERVRQLMETWQGLGRPQGDFWTWLRTQRRQARGGRYRVTQADLELAFARLYTRSDEPMAVTMQFTARYHLIPADRISNADFSSLEYMLAHWRQVGGMAGVRSLGDEALRRLEVYYREHLDDAHRRAWDAWLDSRPTSRRRIRLFSDVTWEEARPVLDRMRAFRRRA